MLKSAAWCEEFQEYPPVLPDLLPAKAWLEKGEDNAILT